MSELFPDTRTEQFDVGAVRIHARIGGNGPPLLLLHGFPQTHLMWHPIARDLMARFTCVMPDLRGYGQSSCPPNSADNSAYAKREMARDMAAVMAQLGFDRFAVVGHDRGGRVSYRMALDRPELVKCLAVLDIVPTHAMWSGMNAKVAMKAYHWAFLAQPYPMPETLLEKSALQWIDHTLAAWTGSKDLSAFHPQALAAYRAMFAEPERIHALCNDYRAGATIDLAIDGADVAAGRRIAAPTLALWGQSGFPSETAGPLATWQEWCERVEGRGIPGGHFIVEENPRDTLAALMPFLDRHGR
jgi:haloacetate dehalogenase